MLKQTGGTLTLTDKNSWGSSAGDPKASLGFPDLGTGWRLLLT